MPNLLGFSPLFLEPILISLSTLGAIKTVPAKDVVSLLGPHLLHAAPLSALTSLVMCVATRLYTPPADSRFYLQPRSSSWTQCTSSSFSTFAWAGGGGANRPPNQYVQTTPDNPLQAGAPHDCPRFVTGEAALPGSQAKGAGASSMPVCVWQPIRQQILVVRPSSSCRIWPFSPRPSSLQRAASPLPPCPPCPLPYARLNLLKHHSHSAIYLLQKGFCSTHFKARSP